MSPKRQAFNELAPAMFGWLAYVVWITWFFLKLS